MSCDSLRLMFCAVVAKTQLQAIIVGIEKTDFEISEPCRRRSLHRTASRAFGDSMRSVLCVEVVETGELWDRRGTPSRSIMIAYAVVGLSGQHRER